MLNHAAAKSVTVLAILLTLATSAAPAEVRPAVPSAVPESARQIPVVAQVDVVVVGGSLGGVAAAIQAANSGASVFLAAPRTYLGDDVCATQRFWLEAKEKPAAPLARKLFGDDPAAGVPTPMHVKRTLDQALLAAKVDFLYSCYVTDVLRDASGKPCGIVMANRAGRQAVLAKTIIDATQRSTVARLAGAKFAPYPAGAQTFQRIVVGGEPQAPSGDTVRKLPFTRSVAGKGRSVPVYEYTLHIPMADGSWNAFAAAEQTARDRTFDKGQLDASESLFQVPPDPMQGVAKLTG